MIQVDCQVEFNPMTAQPITALQASMHTWYCPNVIGKSQPGIYQLYTWYITGIYHTRCRLGIYQAFIRNMNGYT